jgi:molecular chaperone DnaK
MVKEAETNVEEDRSKKEEVEARNRADHLVYSTENMLNEHRDKIDQSDAEAIEKAIAETKKAIEEGGSDAINRATENLTQVSHRLAEGMYQSTQQQQQQQPQAQAQSDERAEEGTQQEGEVIDAEYVDVDEKK